MEDEDGSWHANLIEPLERFVMLRRAGFVIGLTLLRMAKRLSIPMATSSWLRPNKLALLHSPNRAIHVRVRTSFRPH